MSKQRARARAVREAQASRTADQQALVRRRTAAANERRERRALAWRRLRLWQRGPASPGRRRVREAVGVAGVAVLLVLVVVWTTTRSVPVIVAAALVCVVAGPVLVKILLERSDR